MQPAYVDYLEAKTLFLRAQLAEQHGMIVGMDWPWNEPMKVAVRETCDEVSQTHKNHCRRKSNAYTAISRPPRASRANNVDADGKTLVKRLEESAEQLNTAGVVMADDVAVKDVVELYMKAPADLRKAVRVHAASKLVPDAESMSNDEKIAAANNFKSQIKAAVTHLEEDQANDICSLLMKAIVDHMGIAKDKKKRR